VQHFTKAEIRQIEDRYQDFLNAIRHKFDEERLARKKHFVLQMLRTMALNENRANRTLFIPLPLPKL